MLLLLVFAAVISCLTGSWADAAIVLLIVFATVAVGYSREYQAQTAAAKLRRRIHARARVERGGQTIDIPLREVVPGDVVLLSAGSLVPADARLIDSTDCFVNQAILTGESFPVEKSAVESVAADAALVERRNCVFQGTNVRNGTARCVAVRTGTHTEFGAIAHRLSLRPPETEFDRGIRRFGYLLTRTMFVMVLLVFTANLLLGRPTTQTLLFSVALAVGLTPELLPAILSVNLARGARAMASHGVLVRRLSAIENLGSMDVLCTDKTGTLTEGTVRLEGAYDERGNADDGVLRLAALNASTQTGLTNALDEAILQAHPSDAGGAEKLGEVPYDFIRKRVSVVVREADGGMPKLITKGAFEPLLLSCTRSADGADLDAARRADITRRFIELSNQGTRVLAVASRPVEERSSYGRSDEQDLEFQGILTFSDHPKEGVAQALCDLRSLGISVKMITGDAKLVAQHLARHVGMKPDRFLTGAQLDALHDEALWQAAEKTDLFVEVDPNQKERIILSLKKMGHVVGFLGDGVNDAPAMHAADTSLSVEDAVDVAREAADFVLLQRDLDVIRRGVVEGRRTFANTLKYVLITMSANLGNMISMAVASLWLPFLPLLASQILLNNFLSDIPAIGLADDAVDPELVGQPRRWDMRFIRRFMIEFGLISSAFDFVTFAALLALFASNAALFRTGWFTESLLTELAIALVVRTRRPFFRSRPGTLLLSTSAGVAAAALVLPYLPFATALGFAPLPFTALCIIVGITAIYVLTTELYKPKFYDRFDAVAGHRPLGRVVVGSA
jgi:Mg2+-importing ATPase